MKEEKFFGWCLHRVCTGAEVPMRFALLLARLHDLNPLSGYPLAGGRAIMN